MAVETTVGFLIHERELRAKLGVRPKPYFVRVADGLHLGYRKGKTISRWVVRRSRAGNYEMQTLFGVEPDDRLPADGLRVLNFQQVMAKLMNDTSKPLRCSFCGKDHTQVDKLVAGPGVFICDACVGLCQLYMDHPAEQGKLLLEDGKPVFDDGNPVFVPLTEAEQEERRRLLDQP